MLQKTKVATNNIIQKPNCFSITLLSLILLTVYPFTTTASYHDSQRFLSILIFSILGYNLLIDLKLSMLQIASFILFSLLGLISTLLSPLPLWSGIEFLLFFSILSIVLSFKAEINSEYIYKTVLTFTLLNLIYIVRSLVNYVIVIAHQSVLDRDIIIDGFSNIRFYAQFISWTIPFILAFISTHPQAKYKSLMWTVTILSTGLVLLSGTRAFILGILFSLLSIYWLVPQLAKQYFKVNIINMLAALVIYITMVFIIPYSFDIDNTTLLMQNIGRDMTNSSGRLEIWLITLRVFLENPYFGVGPMMLALEGTYTGVAHPHNMPLQILAEWGGIMAFLIFTLLVYLALSWKKLLFLTPPERNLLAFPISASISSALAVSMVDGIIVMPVSLIYLCLMLGLANALWVSWTPDTLRFNINKYWAVILYAPILVLTVITTYQWLYPDLLALGASHPRFWQNGILIRPN
ncbi:MAG: hypothetical protein RLZZ422_26 [Pseudomonadota bacterium]